MFESFVIMLREGVEAALVIGIILVVLRRSERRHLERPVFWGVGLAVLASIGAAVALQLLPINEEAYEGALYWTAAVFVASMMWWMHRNARMLRARIEQRVQRAIGAVPERSVREAWALGAFAFLMVFREGAETVMFLSAVNLTTDAMLSFIGTLAGLALAIVFAVTFVRGSLHVDLHRFFIVPSGCWGSLWRNCWSTATTSSRRLVSSRPRRAPWRWWARSCATILSSCWPSSPSRCSSG